MSYFKFIRWKNKWPVYGWRIDQFTAFKQPLLEKEVNVPEGDFIADPDASLYYVSVDVKGEIGWESGTFCKKGRPEAHVIEIITKETPLSYRAYLRKHRVSYIIAGEKQLNCELAMEKLYRLFHIEKLLICGGGMVNWTFLQAGMIDELSLLLSPVTDGSRGEASLFTRMPFMKNGKENCRVEFELKSVKKIGRGGLYLNYLAKNAVKQQEEGLKSKFFEGEQS